MSSLGELIKTYRQEHDLSLREFAQKCGISHSYIDKLEKGSDPRTGKPVIPTIETIRLLADGLGMNLADLMLAAGYLPNENEDFNSFLSRVPIPELQTALKEMGQDQLKDRLARCSPEELQELIIDFMHLVSMLNTSDDPKSLLAAWQKSLDLNEHLMGGTVPVVQFIDKRSLASLPVGSRNIPPMIRLPVLGVIRAGQPMYAEENIIDWELVAADDVKDGAYFFLQITGDSMIDAGIKPGSRVLIRKQDYAEDGQIAVVLVNGYEATIKRVKWADGKAILYAANKNYEPQIYNAAQVKILGRAVKVMSSLD